ncbi:hypothetical protein, partial [Methanosarcina mazei]
KIFKVKNEEARVHFIPTLKDGVFVTLCAPLVIKLVFRQNRFTGRNCPEEQNFQDRNILYYSSPSTIDINQPS